MPIAIDRVDFVRGAREGFNTVHKAGAIYVQLG